ncbi:Gfo/Idh/MocA family protein [Candidatus Nucleicultrix amoebiphila]|jgi:predicted dehydrogenase|uniref:Oxidoreductase n=1 Tax=Candidatus Nucleicultrix amoebiphila FS5 TaxID=1414854 RepID=A0A1W6N5J9_9PROT|nr:Gfo/Idh/MocA family oxidoreductase [Candidatus Nucleicultrix amoebiphila]ARN85056.1 hypothetical protein GQ61_06865 [Candidatus Nucleicultrix amoebiphila FS5]
MKILVLGGGSIGKRHIKNLLSAIDSKQQVFVVEPKLERQREIINLGVAQENIFNSRDDALKSNQYTGAIIATPTSMHYEDAFALVTHGCHMMIEKPLGIDASHSEQLEKKAREKNIFIFTAYCFRFDPVANKFHQLIKEGIVGKPLYARAEMSTYLPDWHPHEDYRTFYMAKKVLGGGTLLDQSHLYDMTQWFFGDFSSVFGITKKHSDLEIETDDFGEFIFNMKSNIKVSIHIDLFTRPWREFYQVTGEKGTLLWDIHTRKIILEHTDNKREVVMEGADYNQMYINELDYFLKQLKEPGKVSGPKYIEGKRVVEIIDAIRQSSAEGKLIQV